MSATPKKILFLHGSNDLYGASRVLIQLLALLGAEGHELHLVLPYRGPLDKVLSGQQVRISYYNLGVLRRKYLSLVGLLNRSCKIFRAVNFLTRYLRSQQIDLVYSNTTVVLSGGIAARLRGLPSIYHCHELPASKGLYASLMGRLIQRLATRVIVVSEAVRTHWSQWVDPEKLCRVYNAVSLPNQLPSADKTSPYQLTAIGRISPLKGHQYLVEMAAILMRQRADLQLVIVGDVFKGYESYEESLKEQVRSLGLEDRIHLLGFRADMAAVFASTDLLIHPSILPDSLPTVLLEAMSHGIPVVATQLGGNIELLDRGKNGLLIPVEDAETAAAQVLAYIEDQALQQAHIARSHQRLATIFNPERFKEAIRAVVNPYL